MALLGANAANQPTNVVSTGGNAYLVGANQPILTYGGHVFNNPGGVTQQGANFFGTASNGAKIQLAPSLNTTENQVQLALTPMPNQIVQDSSGNAYFVQKNSDGSYILTSFGTPMSVAPGAYPSSSSAFSPAPQFYQGSSASPQSSQALSAQPQNTPNSFSLIDYLSNSFKNVPVWNQVFSKENLAASYNEVFNPNNPNSSISRLGLPGAINEYAAFTAPGFYELNKAFTEAEQPYLQSSNPYLQGFGKLGKGVGRIFTEGIPYTPIFLYNLATAPGETIGGTIQYAQQNPIEFLGMSLIPGSELLSRGVGFETYTPNPEASASSVVLKAGNKEFPLISRIVEPQPTESGMVEPQASYSFGRTPSFKNIGNIALGEGEKQNVVTSDFANKVVTQTLNNAAKQGVISPDLAKYYTDTLNQVKQSMATAVKVPKPQELRLTMDRSLYNDAEVAAMQNVLRTLKAQQSTYGMASAGVDLAEVYKRAGEQLVRGTHDIDLKQLPLASQTPEVNAEVAARLMSEQTGKPFEVTNPKENSWVVVRVSDNQKVFDIHPNAVAEPGEEVLPERMFGIKHAGNIKIEGVQISPLQNTILDKAFSSLAVRETPEGEITIAPNPARATEAKSDVADLYALQRAVAVGTGRDPAPIDAQAQRAIDLGIMTDTQYANAQAAPLSITPEVVNYAKASAPISAPAFAPPAFVQPTPVAYYDPNTQTLQVMKTGLNGMPYEAGLTQSLRNDASSAAFQRYVQNLYLSQLPQNVQASLLSTAPSPTSSKRGVLSPSLSASGSPSAAFSPYSYGVSPSTSVSGSPSSVSPYLYSPASAYSYASPSASNSYYGSPYYLSPYYYPSPSQSPSSYYYYPSSTSTNIPILEGYRSSAAKRRFGFVEPTPVYSSRYIPSISASLLNIRSNPLYNPSSAIAGLDLRPLQPSPTARRQIASRALPRAAYA